MEPTRGRPDRGLGGGARRRDAQLLASRVDRGLRHQAEGRQLSSDDTQDSLDAVAYGMVEDGVCSGQVAGGIANRLRRAVERTHSRPSAQRTVNSERGDEDFALGHDPIDLPTLYAMVRRIIDFEIGYAEYHNRADRDDDVSVLRRPASIDNRVHKAGRHGDHAAFAENDAEVDASQGSDMLGPRSGCVDHDFRPDGPRLARACVDD